MLGKIKHQSEIADGEFAPLKGEGVSEVVGQNGGDSLLKYGKDIFKSI